MTAIGSEAIRRRLKLEMTFGADRRILFACRLMALAAADPSETGVGSVYVVALTAGNSRRTSCEVGTVTALAFLETP
jgi:hypothetical protein